MAISKYKDQLQRQFRIATLISGFIRKELTREEEIELDQWIMASEQNLQLFEDITDEKALDDFLSWHAQQNVEQRLAEVKQRISFGRTRWFKSVSSVSIAAVLIITIGYFAWRLVPGARQPQTISKVVPDILPGSAKAELRMANGIVIVLDDIRDTVINPQVQVQDGEIIYASNAGEPVEHILNIPRKGFYKIILPDGTRAWLNSESSLTYPSVFSAMERKVKVTGEVYFEIAKDIARPFIVNASGINIQAIGTAFNVNTYLETGGVQTTLLEGKVKLWDSHRGVVLQPGEQLQIRSGHWAVVEMTDPGVVIAWTQNKFRFQDLSIKQVMKQLERWYDARVVYQSIPDHHFNGEIQRELPVSKVLALLEATGQVHFEIVGNKIIVKK